jgi:hypothetical protein
VILGFIINIKIRLFLLLCLNNIIELHHSLLIPRSRFAIAPQHPQIAIPAERNAYAHNPNFKRTACSSAYAIALPTSPNCDRTTPILNYRTPTSQTAIPAERNAYAHNHPNFKRSHTTPILNYRTPTSQTAIPAERFAIAHNPNFKRSPIFLD